tara:strand:- start:853 stop:2322 length:1470 start_codon:yes stop_codon:yes gene_type:complete
MLRNLRASLRAVEHVANLRNLRTSLAAIEIELARSDAWESGASAARSARRSAEAASLARRLAEVDALTAEAAALAELHAMALEETDDAEGASELVVELDVSARQLAARGDALWRSTVFAAAAHDERLRNGAADDEDLDPNACFVEITAGAGGDDACDWVRMLLRMYAGWAASADGRVELVEADASQGGGGGLVEDMQRSSSSRGSDGGGGLRDALGRRSASLRSGTLRITRERAGILLAGEAGTHRLVRISPFDAAKRRHTSLAQVLIYPAPVAARRSSGSGRSDRVAFKANEIRIDTFRAQGAGGQHVNTTDSAVRIVHLETGLSVTAQNERSQHRNRATAEVLLRAKLRAQASSAREAERVARRVNLSGRGFGASATVRSYVLHPYTLAKQPTSGVTLASLCAATPRIENGTENENEKELQPTAAACDDGTSDDGEEKKSSSSSTADVDGVLNGGDSLDVLLFARIEDAALAGAHSRKTEDLVVNSN